MRGGKTPPRARGLALLATVLLGAPPAGAATLTRGPYLQLLTTQSVTVVWHTDQAAPCGLAFRPVGGTATVLGAASGPVCAIPVAGLRPGTEYAYTPLASGVPLSGETVFRTDDPTRPFTFLVLGDSGNGGAEQLAVRDRMRTTPADFLVHTGDMIYEDGAAEDFDPNFFVPYQDFLRRVVFWPCLGNHDVRTAGGAPWRDAFYTPANNLAENENYYSFDYGNAHVAVLDSNASTSPGGAQYTFLDRDLGASRATWKFVVFHHTIFSSGQHGSSTRIRSNLVPLFDQHGVDVVFMGHDHHYERTRPLRGGQVVGAGAGTVYITTGGAGKSIRPVGTSSFTAFAESAFHFTRVAIDEGALRAEMVRIDGVVRDTLTLAKNLRGRCGDGVVQPGEQCDSGLGNSNTIQDACRTNCVRPSCGDGVVDRGEQCEPGVTAGCDASCRLPAGCATDADCDDGNPCTVDACVPGTGCRHDAGALRAARRARTSRADVCARERIPALILRLMRRAEQLADASEQTGTPSRRLRRALGLTARKSALAARRGVISPACSAGIVATLGELENAAACFSGDVAPVADTYVEAGQEAAWDHGGSDHLDVDAGPFGITYLKFDLSGFRQVGHAVLELYVTNASRDGGQVYRIPDSSWVEGTGNGVDASSAGGRGIKWTDVDTDGDGVLGAGDRSALVPQPSEAVAVLGPVERGQVLQLDVTSAFQAGAGVYTLAIMNASRDGTTFTSREHPATEQRPVLHVAAGGGGPTTTTITGVSTTSTSRTSTTAVPRRSTTTSSVTTTTATSRTTTLVSTSTTVTTTTATTRTTVLASTSTTVTTTTATSRTSTVTSTSTTVTPVTTTSTSRPVAPGLRCLTQAGPLSIVSGTYTERYSNRALAANSRVDARTAAFLAGPSNLYPVVLGGGTGVCFAGGKVNGQYDRGLGWEAMHDMNNAGIAFGNAGWTLEGLRVDNVTDGIRPQAQGRFTVRQVWLSSVRDDCLENDHLQGGLVEDSLFDGCYVAVSERPSPSIASEGFDGRGELLTIRGSLLRLQPMPGPRGGAATDLGHGQFFKWHELATRLALHDNIFMAEQVGQSGPDSMGVPNVLEGCSNNVMVWLGRGPYPAALPSCFRVTTDRAAWDNAVADWKRRHPQVE